MSIDIQVECPSCAKKGKIDVPLNLLVETEKGTITIDVPPDVVCNHAFQVFLDKNANIRGYQKIDFQLGPIQTSTPHATTGFTILEMGAVTTSVQDMIQILSPEIFVVLLKGLLFNLPLILVSADEELIKNVRTFYQDRFPAINTTPFIKNADLLGATKGGTIILDLNFSRIIQDPTKSKFAIGQELLKEISSQTDPISQKIFFNNFVDKILRDFKILQRILKEEYKIKAKNLFKTLEHEVNSKIDKSREQFLLEMLQWHSPDLLKNID